MLPPPLTFHPSLPLPFSPPNQFSLPSLSPLQPPLPISSVKRAPATKSPNFQNRLARHRYEILSSYECGISLLGTEIKSIRSGHLNLREGYARVSRKELYLYNVHVAGCVFANQSFDHEPLRVRKLLLHKKEIRKLEELQKQGGITLVPLSAYFNQQGFFKVEIALAKGKQNRDKRAEVKKRDDDREMRRVVKNSVGPI